MSKTFSLSSLPVLSDAPLQPWSNRLSALDVRYEIARQKAADAWLDATTPRPIVGEAAVTAEVERLRNSARDRLRTEARRAWLGPAAGLQAHLVATDAPEATDAMRQAAIETVWRAERRQFVSSQYQITSRP